ncbi:MAG: ABC transporter substrate-binding protein [Rhodospirillales bacterium]
MRCWLRRRALCGTLGDSRTEQAIGFVRDSAGALVAIANGPGSPQDKHRRIGEVLDRSVDLQGIARVCLGRFWHAASQQQQLQYTALSRDLLVTKIADHIGEYQGVRLSIGAARRSADTEIVATTVERPGNEVDEVDWVVSNTTGGPKIVDLLAEGTSMRETQGSGFHRLSRKPSIRHPRAHSRPEAESSDQQIANPRGIRKAAQR